MSRGSRWRGQARRRSPLYGESGHRRVPGDRYLTEPRFTFGLCRNVSFEGGIWEPACGEGHMVRALEDCGHRVQASDIHAEGFGACGIDFLRQPVLPPGCRNVVTNPPFNAAEGEAEAFLRHAIDLVGPVGGRVAFFLRLTFIQRRASADLLSERRAIFAGFFPVQPRPLWGWHLPPELRTEDDNNPRHDFAWFVFDTSRRGRMRCFPIACDEEGPDLFQGAGG